MKTLRGLIDQGREPREIYHYLTMGHMSNSQNMLIRYYIHGYWCGYTDREAQRPTYGSSVKEMEVWEQGCEDGKGDASGD